MKALDHGSALYKRYVGELDDQETRIEALHADIDNLTQQRDAAQSELSAYVSKLTVE